MGTVDIENKNTENAENITPMAEEQNTGTQETIKDNSLHEEEAMLNFAINQQQELERDSREAADNGRGKRSNSVKNVVKTDYTDELRAKNFEKETRRTFGIIKVVTVIVLAAVLFGVAFNLGRRSVKKDPVLPGKATPTPSPEITEAPEHDFAVVDLEDYVSGLNLEELNGFTPSVEDYYGWQYLCFSKGMLKILYRNEYPQGASDYKRIVIDNGNYRTEMKFDYDLTGNVMSLIPHIGSYGGDKSTQLAFVSYRDGFPAAITFIDAERLFNYGKVDIENGLRGLYKVAFTEDPSLENNGKNYQMTFTFSSTDYVYAIPKETFVSGEYDSMDVIDFKEDFVLEFKDDGITFSSYVKTVDGDYLGRMNGTFSKSNLDFRLSGTRYGSFAISSEAGFGVDKVITPRKAPFSEYVTIIAKSGQRFYLAILDTITPIAVNWDNMVVNEDGTYEYVVDGVTKSIMGIDVSAYQNKIEWDKVAAAGVKFAIIRLGYRGYGEGTLEFDKNFKDNIEGAIAAGIKVGVYFFSEAINVDEAVEEAEFVLEAIKDYDVQYPVVFDTEEIANTPARANNLDYFTRTDIARAFCDTVKAAGYTPMIYANSRFMLTAVDLEKLNDIDRWFAYYGLTSQFPYSFNMFQYSESGKIDGIPTAVDLDISFIDYSRDKEK
jgi:GH25 family lysozyme M1 (1,4-beta-N-acetylmuramidase)